MKLSPLFSLCCFLVLPVYSASPGEQCHACLPPRGWNSYDSWCWTINETEFLQSAAAVAKRLLPHRFEYVVVDFLWYRRMEEGANTTAQGFDVIDGWGRMVPDPTRWPSAKDGTGFAAVANRVHDLGLKFGIHVMRGISFQALFANTPILDTTTGKAYEEAGRVWTAKDIALPEEPCPWMNTGFMRINTSLEASKAFLRSLYEQYSQWGVDFIKHDCAFGGDLDVGEVSTVSEILKGVDHPILYSLSPGTNATLEMGKKINKLANMYRITGDDWDSWGDVLSHFNVSRDFAAASMIGAEGLAGNSWPDLDMLPLGWLTDFDSNSGPYRQSDLNTDEQRTQMTLWSMARSPLMFGGDMRRLDDSTYNLITHPTLLEINDYSSNNKEFPHVTNTSVEHRPSPTGNDSVTLLVLVNCSDPRALGWSNVQVKPGVEQVCWQRNYDGGSQSYCLVKKMDSMNSTKVSTRGDSMRRQQLLPVDKDDDCLDVTPSGMPVARFHRRIPFQPCKNDDDNQMWELTPEGTLLNEVSGHCAAAMNDRYRANEVRSWIATGRNGEIYVAFFNLYDEEVEMSVKLKEVSEAVPETKKKAASSCHCTEVWSGKNVDISSEMISTRVNAHGAALFVLKCD